MRFRIVEERRLKPIANEVHAIPAFYVEESEPRFYFFTIWNRYFMAYDTEEEARNFLNARIEEVTFKPVIRLSKLG